MPKINLKENEAPVNAAGDGSNVAGISANDTTIKKPLRSIILRRKAPK